VSTKIALVGRIQSQKQNTLEFCHAVEGESRKFGQSYKEIPAQKNSLAVFAREKMIGGKKDLEGFSARKLFRRMLSSSSAAGLGERRAREEATAGERTLSGNLITSAQKSERSKDRIT